MARLVHRSGQILNARQRSPLAQLAAPSAKIRREALPHPARAHPHRGGQIRHRGRAGEAHGRGRGQGRDDEELPADASGE